MYKKKSISKLMLLIALFSILLLVASTTAEAKDRYTVLVLDVSGSMAGTPIAELRKATITFYEKILADTTADHNYVAIVAYATSASVRCDFINDIAQLTSVSNNLYAVGGTNIAEGLQYAKTLFSNLNLEDRTDVIRNILILSDGIPESGTKSTSGPYTNADNSCYQYANAAYNTASSLWPNYKIYSLGFFHSLISGGKGAQDLEFGQRVMSDLQNAGYYNVIDGNELEFTFGEIADDIVTEGNYPIIYIPGIMGSNLYAHQPGPPLSLEDWDNMVWLPDTAHLENFLPGHLGRVMDISQPLYLSPHDIDQAERSEWEQPEGTLIVGSNLREYGARAEAKEIMDALCDTFGDEREVYFFSYDWRKSIKDNANILAAFIETLTNRETTLGLPKKVDLVCHSMGGLVAASYYANHKQLDKLNKVITAGTPYEGAPVIIYRCMTPTIAEDPIADTLLEYSGLNVTVKTGFIGALQLIPSKQYYGKIPMSLENLSPPAGAPGGRFVLNYENYKNLCKDIYEREKFERNGNVEAAVVFQDELRAPYDNGTSQTIVEYNQLLNFSNSYFAVGTSHQTITSPHFVRTNVMSPVENITLDDLSYGTGDGTVPYISSTMINMLSNLPDDRWESFGTTHGGLIGHVDEKKMDADTINETKRSLQWIIEMLKSGNSTVKTGNKDPKGKYIVIRIACPVDVTISSDNESLLFNGDGTHVTRTSFGRMDVIGANNDIKMFCLNENDDYSLEMQGTDTGTMDYSIRFFDQDENLVDERNFVGVPITESTKITTGTVKEEPTVLHIDSDGDGNVDVTWSAPGNSTSTTPDSAPSDDPITSIQPTSITFDNGQTTYFLTLEDGSESVLSVNIAPYNATETNLTWYSSDSNAVTINPVVAATVRQSAKLAGVGVGTATVTVSTSNGLSATATVTVTPAENPTLTIDLSQLSLQNGTLKLEVGEIVDATIRSNPAGASFKATGLPNGLTLNSTGHLSGSASVAGTYPVRVEATLNGITKTAAFEIEVATVTGSRKPSSGSGCNAGTGSMALTMLAASILAITKRKGQ